MERFAIHISKITISGGKGNVLFNHGNKYIAFKSLQSKENKMHHEIHLLGTYLVTRCKPVMKMYL